MVEQDINNIFTSNTTKSEVNKIYAGMNNDVNDHILLIYFVNRQNCKTEK